MKKKNNLRKVRDERNSRRNSPHRPSLASPENAESDGKERMRKMGLGWGKLNADRECEGGNRADDGSHRRPPPFPAADEGVRKKRNRKGGGGREACGLGYEREEGVRCFYSKGGGACLVR